MQMVYNNQIMIPCQFYNWDKDNVAKMNILYIVSDEYEAEPRILKSKLEAATTIKGTQQLHNYSRVNQNK